MLMLAVDTSTEVCTVGLAENQRLLGEITLGHGQTHARFLMQAIDHLFALTGTTLNDVQAFVAGRGPGSFTGLRIGISTVKGLAMAGAKPLVGVSSLAVLAHQADGDRDLVCPMLDARRKEVYWSLYRREDDQLVPQVPERVGDVLSVIDTLDRPCTFIGNGALLYRTKLEQAGRCNDHWPPPESHTVRAAVLARLGWQRLRRGESVPVESFSPVYLRKSDAEINRNHP